MAKLTHIVDWTIKNIRIEAHPTPSHYGWNPYACFTVYPVSGVIVRATVGTITSKGGTSKLVSESVSVTKRLTQVGMVINSLVSYSGVLFDENDNLVTPNFSVSNGMLLCAADCTGNVVIEYYATVHLFEYNAQIDNMAGGGVNIKRGLVFAYDANAPKNITQYEIPENPFSATEQVRLARVYREILVADKRYEMPETLTDAQIAYAHYPSADVSELDVSTRKDELTQYELLWDGFNVQHRDRYTKDWCYPTTDSAQGFFGVVWKFSEEVPEELATNQQVIDALAALKLKFGVA